MFENNPAEDIFEKTDAAKAPPSNLPVASGAAPALPPIAPQSLAPSPIPEAPMGGHGMMKTAIILFLAFGAIAVAAYLTYVFMAKPPSTVDGESDDITGGAIKLPEEEGKGEEEAVVNEPVVTEPEDKSALMDSDGDGLTNAEELEVGTAVSKPDTDSDGLGDREEVKVYGTDPKRTDTDDDGFLDGQEVAGGYNPNGPGKLLEVPKDETTP